MPTGRATGRMTHGTRYAYQKAGCRCASCCDWNAQRARDYRRKRALMGRPVDSTRRRRRRSRKP